MISGRSDISDHADRNAESGEPRLSRAQTSSPRKGDGESLAACFGQGFGGEQHCGCAILHRLSRHTEIIKSHRTLDQRVEAGHVHLDATRSHADRGGGYTPETRTGPKQATLRAVDGDLDVRFALRRERLLADATYLDPAKSDRRTAIERLGLLGLQTHAERGLVCHDCGRRIIGLGHAADEPVLQRTGVSGVAFNDHAGDQSLESADALERNFRLDENETRAAGAQEIETRIELRGDFHLPPGHGKPADHADGDTEVCHARMPGAQTASVGESDDDGFAASFGQGLGLEQRDHLTLGERFSFHPEIIEGHPALDEGVETGHVHFDPAWSHADRRCGHGPETRTRLEQAVFALLDGKFDVGFALGRERLLAHASDFDPAVSHGRAAVERLGLLRFQADPERCLIGRQHGAGIEPGELVTSRTRSLPRPDRVPRDERGQSACALQREFGTLDPEIRRFHGKTRREFFQAHCDDGLVEFFVEVDLGYRAGDHAAENERRLSLLHARRVIETDPDFRAERPEVIAIHPDRGPERDDRKKPRERNPPALADNLAVILRRRGLRLAHDFASRQILRTS